jgi:cell division protein FtsN
MKSRTFLKILVTISIIAFIGSAAGLFWYYRIPEAPPEPQETVQPEVEIPDIPEPEPQPEPVTPPATAPEPEVEPEPQPEPPVAETPKTKAPADEELEKKEFYYWVVTGTYDGHEQAEGIVDQLESYELPARIHIQAGAYEVRIGPYDAVEEAEHVASRVGVLEFVTDKPRVKIVLNR